MVTPWVSFTHGVTIARMPYNHNEYMRAYRKKNRPAIRKQKVEYMRLYRKINKDKIRNSYLLKNYKISSEEKDFLLKAQGGCGVCGCKNPRGTRGWRVDHCHKTGVIRGVLCNPCNLGLGHFLESPEVLLRAAEYLRKINPTCGE